MSKVLKKKFLSRFTKAVAVTIMLALPLPAMAATTDLGHGSGCHEHNDSCYHTHTDDCYGTRHYDLYATGWEHDWREGSCYVCPKCGNRWSNSNYEWEANDWSSTNKHYICPKCYQFEWNEYDNYKAPHYDQYLALKCTALIDTDVVLCDKGNGIICGKTEQCIIPKITYQLPTAWTNQNITINYTGTKTGSLTFTENGTKSVEVTSSTGHKIREDITVKTIDRIAPAMPTYKNNNQ